MRASQTRAATSGPDDPPNKSGESHGGGDYRAKNISVST